MVCFFFLPNFGIGNKARTEFLGRHSSKKSHRACGGQESSCSPWDWIFADLITKTFKLLPSLRNTSYNDKYRMPVPMGAAWGARILVCLFWLGYNINVRLPRRRFGGTAKFYEKSCIGFFSKARRVLGLATGMQRQEGQAKNHNKRQENMIEPEFLIS
jgi:hypothetical protein